MYIVYIVEWQHTVGKATGEPDRVAKAKHQKQRCDMVSRIDPALMLKMKKWGYLAFWLIMIPLLPLSAFVGNESGTQNYWAWFLYFVIFGIIPILDYIIGKDPSNPNEEVEVPAMSEEKTYRWFTLLMVPIWFGVLFWAGWVFMHNNYNWFGMLGWIVSIGTVGGIIAINLGHELIHKDPKIENWAGGLLLASVTYAGFKVEHVRGHHVNVSTPEDASSSRYGQSLYAFLPHAFVHNFINAWRLEADYLKRKGKKAFSIHNELIWWYTISGPPVRVTAPSACPWLDHPVSGLIRRTRRPIKTRFRYAYT